MDGAQDFWLPAQCTKQFRVHCKRQQVISLWGNSFLGSFFWYWPTIGNYFVHSICLAEASNAGPFFGDMFEFDLNMMQWKVLPTSGPSPGSRYGFGFGTVQGRFLVFGGFIIPGAGNTAI
jgi:hypothetical protein